MKYGRLVAACSIADDMERDLAFTREIAAAFISISGMIGRSLPGGQRVE